MKNNTVSALAVALVLAIPAIGYSGDNFVEKDGTGPQTQPQKMVKPNPTSLKIYNFFSPQNYNIGEDGRIHMRRDTKFKETNIGNKELKLNLKIKTKEEQLREDQGA